MTPGYTFTALFIRAAVHKGKKTYPSKLSSPLWVERRERSSADFSLGLTIDTLREKATDKGKGKE